MCGPTNSRDENYGYGSTTTLLTGTTSCQRCEYGQRGVGNECLDCTLGTYQDTKGEMSCKDCLVDTYGTVPKSVSNAECKPCAEDKTTGNVTGATNATQCKCRRELYYQKDVENCAACIVGADCSAKDGITLVEMSAKPGYWRPDATSEVFSPCVEGYSTLDAQELADNRCCPKNTIDGSNVSICVRNKNSTFNHPDEQCKVGYSGALCLVCASGFVKQGINCVVCEAGASILFAAMPLIAMLLIMFVVLLLVLS